MEPEGSSPYTQEPAIVRFRGFLWYFVTRLSLYNEELLEPRTTPKLEDRYAIRVMKQYVPLKILIMIYYAYFRSLVDCGLMIWGNSPYSNHIFRLQKKKK
jgi:hypothetical protein